MSGRSDNSAPLGGGDAAGSTAVRPGLAGAHLDEYEGRAARRNEVDLAGVRFLDMPWLLQPDHPAVMVYPRPAFGGAVELDRFYALGIDAFRIARSLLAGKSEAALDGVTGRLTLGRDRHYVRALTAAQFNDGRLVVRERP